MTPDALRRAREEIEQASETASNEDVARQLLQRADELSRLAERLETADEPDPFRDHHALRPVSLDVGDAPNTHVVEANRQLRTFRQSGRVSKI